MKRVFRRAAGVLAACAGALPAHAETLVKMTPEVQARLGLKTAPLAAVRRSGQAAGFARGLDVTPLATLEADLVAASASARASAAEASRTAALAKADATVSRKFAEAAAAQARGDAARVTLLRVRVGLEWGAALAAMSDARRERLVAAVAAGRAALVRIDRPGAASAAANAAELDLGAHGRLRAVVLGPVRAGDPRATTPGVLALASGPAAAWVGVGIAVPTTLTVQGSVAVGVVVPREALLRTAGATFAYVRRDAQTFERRPITDGVPQADGMFAPAGFRTGESVVVSGAAKLFAAETTPAKED